MTVSMPYVQTWKMTWQRL